MEVARGKTSHSIPATRQDAENYYRAQLSIKDYAINIGDNVICLVVDFAVDGFEIGQWIDALDKGNTMRAAEVAEIKADEIEVHHIGYDSEYNEWISKTSFRIAPAFAFTCIEPDHNRKTGMMRPYEVEMILKEPSLSFLNESHVQSICEELGSDFQTVVNAALTKT
jgi:hypothetical protein